MDEDEAEDVKVGIEVDVGRREESVVLLCAGSRRASMRGESAGMTDSRVIELLQISAGTRVTLVVVNVE